MQCRLAKLAKDHGVPLREEAVSTAGDSDAESFGQPVSASWCQAPNLQCRKEKLPADSQGFILAGC
jgi:hypothetical protein